ncbi:MAG: 16S rRNA (uracil(1498)-N(3))-methyltransferase [Clostridia bacterium]|nr:16S rRNA (uracil(1498)-N(3))-methyltransferase [Clostridia bacterium]
MSRFFVNLENISENTARIYGEDARHITKVLRMTTGEKVVLCDGLGMDYEATITGADKESVSFSIENKTPTLSESPIRVTLFQGLPKSGKMELIIQKCVELGVHEIVPVKAHRSVVKLNSKDEANKLARYNRIAYEAAKQSQRGIIPRVLPFTAFKTHDFSRFDAVIVAYEEETERTLKQALSGLGSAKNIALIIGPEGGLEKDEVNHMVNCGGISVTLGKRILRTETAGMATLAMIMYGLDG